MQARKVSKIKNHMIRCFVSLNKIIKIRAKNENVSNIDRS
jgi:hypothetical protein